CLFGRKRTEYHQLVATRQSLIASNVPIHWGFLSQDHIIGKASFIWMSISPKGSVRWKRLGFVE
ncbi:MAG: hypothetical protein AAFU64_16810, partial [Bacteroidota bacterium]